MNDYIKAEFTFIPYSSDETDILNSLLAIVGFESFTETPKGTEAYIDAKIFNEDIIKASMEQYPFKSSITWDIEKIDGMDWNEEWEKNSFVPQIFDGKCVIHSTDHSIEGKYDYDITINPRMAFGTGHHETTSLMIHEMLQLDLDGKNVLDMGTGTGVLAILSSMRGAENVIGVEIDEFAYENAKENVKLNCIDNIRLIRGDADSLKKYSQYFDVIFANINRNIILNDIEEYVKSLKHDGMILLSGFFQDDVSMIVQRCQSLGLIPVHERTNNSWCLLKLDRQQRITDA